jgi:hypothetical protein
MRKPAAAGRAVQCLISGGMFTTSPGRSPARGFAPSLIPALPAGDQQNLAALAVDVPVVAASGVKVTLATGPPLSVSGCR